MTNAVGFYRGPSLLTGAPIVAVLNGLSRESDNPKTGAMVQTYILRSDMPPNEAIARGLDDAICGACPLRSGHRYDRGCYVTWWFAPMNVYKALPETPFFDPAELAPLLRDREVRVGSYGDPAAIPFEAWDRVMAEVGGWTGYTHQWRHADPRWKDLVMASVEGDAGADEAHAAGWRTFRKRHASEPVRADEVICPASEEAGHKVQCAACQLCRGQANPAKSVVIMEHGQFNPRQVSTMGL